MRDILLKFLKAAGDPDIEPEFRRMHLEYCLEGAMEELDYFIHCLSCDHG